MAQFPHAFDHRSSLTAARGHGDAARVDPTCPSCGEPLPARARFCPACAAPVSAGGTAAPERRVVSVFFSDVAGSTELGERLDPEVVRGVMNRYFSAVSAALERHGGHLEKFIGDAVVALFGVPAAHEDDALRCVRAAVEARAAVRALGDELESPSGCGWTCASASPRARWSSAPPRPVGRSRPATR